MKAARTLAAAIEAGLFVAFMAALIVVGVIVTLAGGFAARQWPRLHRTRDTIVFCVALACAWAAAQIDDPAPAVAIATAAR